GIDRYALPRIPRLSYAVADARAVAESLPRFGFEAGRIVLLENEAATREAIHRALTSEFGAMQRDDRLFVFFALHGEIRPHRNGEEGYLLPFDADLTNLPLSAIPMADLAQIGQRCPAKHVLFTLDTCFSGYAAHRDVLSGAADLKTL